MLSGQCTPRRLYLRDREPIAIVKGGGWAPAPAQLSKHSESLGTDEVFK